MAEGRGFLAMVARLLLGKQGLEFTDTAVGFEGVRVDAFGLMYSGRGLTLLVEAGNQFVESGTQQFGVPLHLAARLHYIIRESLEVIAQGDRLYLMIIGLMNQHQLELCLHNEHSPANQPQISSLAPPNPIILLPSRLLILQSMPYEFDQFQTQYPTQYATLQTRPNTTLDATKKLLYYYTPAKKQGWLSTHPINLILRQPQQPQHAQQYLLYLQKLLYLDPDLDYAPVLQPHTPIRIVNIKMLARQTHLLTIAYLNEHNTLEEWNIHFANAKVAEAWEQLLKNKKAQAIKIRNKSEDRDELIKRLNTQLKLQEEQLTRSKMNHDKLLLEFNLLKDEKDRYKDLSRFLEEELIALKSFVDKCIAEKQQISSAKQREYGELMRLKEEKLRESRKGMDCQIERCLQQKQKIEAEMSLRKENIDLRIANARIAQQREELGCTNKQLEKQNAKLRQELAGREEEMEGWRKDENRLLSKSTCIVSDHEHQG